MSWSTVQPLTDGTKLSADLLNSSTINPLIERTQYLYDRLQVLDTDDALSGVRITTSIDPMWVGKAVYWGEDSGSWGWRLAQANAIDFPITTEVNKSSYVVGICESPTTVLLYGKSTILDINSVSIQSGDTVREGPYYLSASDPGSLTTTKPEVAVFLGSFFNGIGIVHPHIRDNADAHTHYAFTLSDNPVGTPQKDSGGGDVLVGLPHTTYNGIDEIDWATPVVRGFNIGNKYLNINFTISIVGVNYLMRYKATQEDGFEHSGDITIAKSAIYTNLFTLGTTGIEIYFVPPIGSDNTESVISSSQGHEYDISDTTSLKGWIPVSSNPSHAGYIALPPNVKNDNHSVRYAYNMGFDGELSRYYPPTPLSSSSLVYNGAEMYEGTRFSVASYIATIDGLLWIDETVNPWKDSSHSSSWDPQIIFYLTRRASGNTNVVTSLKGADGSPIRFRAVGTTSEATSGDLEAVLNLNLSAEDTKYAGYNVVKGSLNNKLLMGPVVERIMVGSGLHIDSYPGTLDGQGVVRISLDEVEGLKGSFASVDLQNAKQARNGMFTFITIPAKVTPSSPTYAFNANFQVPYDSVDAYKVRVIMTVFGDKNVSEIKTSKIKFSYSILPDSGQMGEGEFSILDANDAVVSRDITLQFPANYKAYDPFKVTTGDAGILGYDLPSEYTVGNEMQVTQGDIVGIRVSSDVGSTYDGNLCFMSLRYYLVPIYFL